MGGSVINSVYRELYPIELPHFDGELKMIPFSLESLMGIPDMFLSTVQKMIMCLPYQYGTAYLTVDGRVVKKDETHRRGGPHIDGNYLPQICGWGSSDWKVGGSGRVLTTAEHLQSYESKTGGMLIASSYPACRGWEGIIPGKPGIGGDCSKIELSGKNFSLLKANVVYYGNSQFVHESIPIDKTTFRVMVRITLPMDYPLIN